MSEYKINDTETTNNLETYAKGFQDGWNLAMQEVKKDYLKHFKEASIGAEGSSNQSTPPISANGPTGK